MPPKRKKPTTRRAANTKAKRATTGKAAASRTTKQQRTVPPLKASETRIPTKAFNSVVYLGRRIPVERRGGDRLFLVSAEDVELLQAMEDKADLAIARKRRRETSTPLEEVQRKLGL